MPEETAFFFVGPSSLMRIAQKTDSVVVMTHLLDLHIMNPLSAAARESDVGASH